QCTDARVNMVTPHLFARYPTPEALAGASLTDVEEIIRSTGFYSSKARNLIGMAQRLVEVYDSVVPGAMEDLVTLPGVGRKTANVVRSVALGKILARRALVAPGHLVDPTEDVIEGRRDRRQFCKVTGLHGFHGGVIAPRRPRRAVRG